MTIIFMTILNNNLLYYTSILCIQNIIKIGFKFVKRV